MPIEYARILVTKETKERLISHMPNNITYDHWVNDAIDIIFGSEKK